MLFYCTTKYGTKQKWNWKKVCVCVCVCERERERARERERGGGLYGKRWWWIEWEEMVVDCTETGGGFAERLLLDWMGRDAKELQFVRRRWRRYGGRRGWEMGGAWDGLPCCCHDHWRCYGQVFRLPGSSCHATPSWVIVLMHQGYLSQLW